MSIAAVLNHARTWHVETTDCLEGLRAMPDGCVQCCVTSPPYFGLRDYGVAGQIGLETSPDDYVEAMVAVFTEVRRVLRDDATCWLNLGDSYANDGKWGGHTGGKHAKALHCSPIGRNKRYTGLKPKDLIGIPWRVAFALQADGWFLRSDVIWHKRNMMPESVQDRPTKSHEYVFLLTKSKRYFYDHIASREKSQSGPSDQKKQLESLERIGGKPKELDDKFNKASSATNIGRKRAVGHPSGRNARSVWTISPERFKGGHFAVMPTEIVRRCLLAGTRAGESSLVLDPFNGAGTTGVVARRLGCRYIGLELNPQYAAMARDRIREDAPLLNGA